MLTRYRQIADIIHEYVSSTRNTPIIAIGIKLLCFPSTWDIDYLNEPQGLTAFTANGLHNRASLGDYMTIKTYDRNILRNEALIASADRSIIQYVHIKDASRTIDIISFEELRKLHTIAVTSLMANLASRKLNSLQFNGHDMPTELLPK